MDNTEKWRTFSVHYRIDDPDTIAIVNELKRRLNTPLVKESPGKVKHHEEFMNEHKK